MTKQEFEELADVSVSVEQYDMVEKVYMNFDRWNNSKQDFCKFYKNNGGMQAVRQLYNIYFRADNAKREIKKMQEELKEMHVLYGLYIGG